MLGGPIGAYEEALYPFLTDELRLIEACLHNNVPVMGICLGAQLLARALGARVYPGSAREIGIAPVTLTDPGRVSCLRHLEAAGHQVLHWHGDTFDLPAGATRLASTAVTTKSGVQRGDGRAGAAIPYGSRSGKVRTLADRACRGIVRGRDRCGGPAGEVAGRRGRAWRLRVPK